MDKKEPTLRIVSVLFSVGILSAVLVLLYKILPNPTGDIIEACEKLAMKPSEIRPEFRERWLYILGVFLTPGIILFAYFSAKRFIERCSRFVSAIYASLWTLSTLGIGALVVLTLFIRERFYFMTFDLLAGSVFFTVILYYAVKMIKTSSAYWVDLCAVAFISFVFLHNLFYYNTYYIERLYLFNSHIHKIHFNAVFDSTVQVFLGKQILGDFLSQYGLFAHFLEPIFRIFGLTFFSFSMVMSLLLAASYAFLYKFLRDNIQNRALLLLGFLNIFYLLFFHVASLLTHHVYFQYFPIRFFFPTLAIYLGWVYFHSYSKKLYYALFFLLSASILWNMDTGVIVFLSWLGVLIFDECFGEDWRTCLKKCLRHFLVASCILLSTVGLYSLVMFFRYGQFPNFFLFFEYQKYFLTYGFMMIPMPLWHPWILVMLAYIIGLVHSLHALYKKEKSPQTLSILFLSILGMGIFSYYQGRSHNFCFLNVSYPAVMLCFIYMDTLTRQIQKGNLYPRALIQILLAVFSVFALSMFLDFPIVLRHVYEKCSTQAESDSTPFTQNVAFVKENTRDKTPVLILSFHSGLFYLAAQKACPISIPGISELLIRADYVKIKEYIKNSQDLKIFLDANFENWTKTSPKKDLTDFIKQYYKAEKISLDQNLTLYIKKKE